MISVVYGLVLAVAAIYSYALIDPNITFLNNSHWESFRNAMVQFGYYQRTQSWYVYAALVAILFILYYVLVKRSSTISPFHISLLSAIILLASYPFLTHDFFNYMFDAKIITLYHQNPYLHKALDFPNDPWLRFMHWTHRTYPYGPSFLALTLVPSFLSMGKFLIDFLLFKALFIGLYLGAVYILQKQNRRWAMIFATHPLIVIEGLINGHNDLIAAAVGIMGLYWVVKNRRIGGRTLLVVSAAIKYTTVPLVVAAKKGPWRYIAAVGVVAALGYLSLRSEVQPWYFITLFTLLPFFEESVRDTDIFLAGLLLSYYPYIALGGWDKPEKVAQKHTIIICALAVNILYVVWKRRSQLLPRIQFFSR